MTTRAESPQPESMRVRTGLWILLAVYGLAGCDGDDRRAGPAGPGGAGGLTSLMEQVALKAPGVAPCPNGTVLTRAGLDADGDGVLGADEVDSVTTSCGTTENPAPLSSLVANYLNDDSQENIPQYVKSLVRSYATSGKASLGGQFPLPSGLTDSVRTIPGIASNVVISWMDPLTLDADGPRFGTNADYTAYFGDGWNADWRGDVVGAAPQFNGSAHSGWLWVNHEYLSGGWLPTVGMAPFGQALSLALNALNRGVHDFDVTADSAWTRERVDAHKQMHKTALGGSWFRVNQVDGGPWRAERTPDAQRYDATSNTLSGVTGFALSEADIDDNGASLPVNTVAGILGDCSGAQTPWGTVITAEENVQGYYGDMEDAWSSQQTFDPSNSFGPGNNIIFNHAPVEAADGTLSLSDSSLNHNREVYGFLTEIDPGVDPGTAYSSASAGGDGVGHRKIGAMGRARWENATFVTGTDWRLEDGKPIVLYGGNDRRSGRIYKLVGSGIYTEGMPRAQVRALMDGGTLYVAHFADLDTRTGYTLHQADNTACNGADVHESGAADKAAVFALGCVSPTESNPGGGRWIELGVDSTDVAPNAAMIKTGTTVGAALKDVNWNSIGGFAGNNDVLSALFTASMKIGVMELNRPEDVEWNPVDRRLYIAFTSHGRPYALDQEGIMKNEGVGGIGGVEERRDDEGAIFVLREDDAANPGASSAFTFWAAWQGQRGNGAYDAENPDNIMIDRDGGVWFGTDGNYSESRGTVDGLYYLDLDPNNAAGAAQVVMPTFGKPFRIISGPSNSEATGPAFNADMSTIFFNVQHPGEGGVHSTWPKG